MAFGKAIGAEPLDLLETTLGEIALIAARAMRSTIIASNSPMVPRCRKVAMARRRRLASSSENFAATMARLIACS